MSDRILGGIGLLLAVGYIFMATKVPVPFISDPLGPSKFPIIVGIVLALASVYFLLRPDPDPHWPELGRLLEVAAAVAVLVIYALALPEVGFVVATAFAAAYLSFRLGASLVGSLVAGVLTSVGIYVIFHIILGLSLAKGPWGF